MQNTIRIDGYTFEYSKENALYECRGRVCYDDEHDEVPEQGLWKAALTLQEKLREQGYDAEREHSEKGWVEVVLM